MIQVENVSKAFEDFQLFETLNFEIERGERVSLIGPGSSGKSTILKMILGLITPDEGRVSLMGKEIAQLASKEQSEILSRVGMSFQQGGLFDFMTVAENLMFAMDNMTKLGRDEQQAKLSGLLADVKLPKTETKFPFELSGGMQKRVSIARALCTDPEVAIFDEPTAGLDPVTSTIILNMIKELGSRREGTTLLVATSNVEIGIRFADRIIVVNKGGVVADGAWQELILDGDEWVRNFLSVRLIGLDLDYARELRLPEEFIKRHWKS